MKTSSTTKFSVLFLFVMALYSVAVVAQPTGPDSIERGPSETRATSAGVVQQADGGNVTPLEITGNSQTVRWQGFFGNITGNLTLDDSNGNSLYQWTLANPQGEIYAVNSSVTPIWDNVTCLDLSKPEAEQRVTVTELEAALGMGASDNDGVDETFNLSFSGSFTVGGSVTINAASGCNQTSLNVNDAYDETSFNEVLLTDNTTEENVIYTAIIESDATSFRGATETADFQMIVGEDGSSAGPTNYYFYIELS